MQGDSIGIRVVIGLMPLLSSACGVRVPQLMPASSVTPMRVNACAPHGYCFDWEQHVKELVRAYGRSDRQEDSVAARGPELDLPVQPPLISEADIKGRWIGADRPIPAAVRPRSTEEALEAFSQGPHAEASAAPAKRMPSGSPPN
jgi:hypothetical protein